MRMSYSSLRKKQDILKSWQGYQAGKYLFSMAMVEDCGVINMN